MPISITYMASATRVLDTVSLVFKMTTAMGDSVMNLCLAWKTDAVVQKATTW
ncbi:hypothetical protein L798_03558 [Zootermopsis nevadensis]|uniref:Uncharacterized protein n=1 Tax=Zootermopsis nevadensis TaxID=136037 RepID=A0A067QFM5_ZOONE|nr:hypothetical protein L798_03558 [Zootermopsis nevadensis]